MRKILKEVLSRMLPSATIATCCGMGLLPDWQRHWAAVFGNIVCIMFISIKASMLNQSVFAISQMPLLIDMAATLLVMAIAFYAIGLFAKVLYLLRDGADKDTCVIDAFSGIVLIYALALIAIFAIRNSSIQITDIICTDFLLCNNFFRHLFYSILTIGGPFAIYRAFDMLKIWPCNSFSSNLSGEFFHSMDTVVSAIYTICLLYLIAFIFFNLSIVDAIIFAKGAHQGALTKITALARAVLDWQEQGVLYDFLKEIGVIGLLYHMGLIDELPQA